MENSGTREFEFLKKIGFIRVGGTAEELKAAHIIMDEIRALGIEPRQEDFLMPYFDVKKVKFEILEPEYKEVEVLGWGFTGSTPPEGLTAEFVYAQQGTPRDMKNIKGKIVLLNGLSVSAYEQLIKGGAAGFVTWNGAVSDDPERTDIAISFLSRTHVKYGQCPGVVMRAKDALKMAASGTKKVRMTLIQEEPETYSHDIIAYLPGTEFPDEEICFTAHYDSSWYSTGVTDNGSGSAIILEMLRYFSENPPRRSMRFIWTGAEEEGLYGSKYYASAHQDELDRIKLLVNVDMAGQILGYDKAIVTADVSLQHMVDYLAAEVEFPIETSQALCSSDSNSFADQGVPAISFCRVDVHGTAPIHSRYDLLEHLCPERLEDTTNFIRLFCDRLANSAEIAIPREMPEHLREALDRYMKRIPKKPENK